jgi:hypothetical protein
VAANNLFHNRTLPSARQCSGSNRSDRSWRRKPHDQEDADQITEPAAFVERIIQTLKHEVLNGFCVVNGQHLDHILKIGADWYNKRRGHSGWDHLPPVGDVSDPPAVNLAKHKLVCHTELGGYLK